MTSLNIPDNLPLLAKGSHPRGSGKACIMNAISYLNGDAKITDMPDCALPFLASKAISLNDSICNHRDNGILCAECSHEMWMIGARIIGTADAVKGWDEDQLKDLYARLALGQARSVEHLGLKEAKECNDATEAYLAGRIQWDELALILDAAANAAGAAYAANPAAYAATNAAYSAAYVAAFETNATSAAGSASSADYYASYAASYAAGANAAGIAVSVAEVAAVAAADVSIDEKRQAKIKQLHRLIDQFEELTGRHTQRHWTDADFAVVREGAKL